jgi:putative methyltransferase (TIGR04325 family)
VVRLSEPSRGSAGTLGSKSEGKLIKDKLRALIEAGLGRLPVTRSAYAEGGAPRDPVSADAKPTPQANYFAGDFGSWSEASAAAGQGWATPDILEKVRAPALKAKRGEIAFERDSMAFPSREVRWPLLTCICMAALHSHVGRFHLLDFGGSLGSTYFQHRPELREIPGLQWSIVEQPHFVDCGQREFQDDVLQFFETIGDAAKRAPIDLAMFSGSLQCIPDPFHVLKNAADTGAPYLLLDRLAIIDSDRDLITIKHVVQPEFYLARYPHRAFSKRRLFETIAALRYRVLWDFPQFDRGDQRWMYEGAFCKHL